jgi:hypothetical protein
VLLWAWATAPSRQEAGSIGSCTCRDEKVACRCIMLLALADTTAAGALCSNSMWFVEYLACCMLCASMLALTHALVLWSCLLALAVQ